MEGTKRCSPKGNHGCGERKPIVEFYSDRSHKRRLCKSCNKKYNDYMKARKAVEAQSDVGPRKGSAEHSFFCRVSPCSI